MKVGIVVDDWKLSIFKRRLTEAGYDWTLGPDPFVKNVSAMLIETDDIQALKGVIKNCQIEAARKKRKQKRNGTN